MGKLPLQEIAKAVAIAALFLTAILLLTSTRALGADNRSERLRAILADEAEELRKHDAKESRSRTTSRPLAKRNFERVCVIKPVMADREIENCRVSYRRKDI
jgi:hypothetical protein